MKVTLRYSAYIPSANNNWIAYSLPSAALKQSPASKKTCERSSSQWRTLQLDCWINVQCGIVPANNHASNAASLIRAIKPHLLNIHPCSLGLTVIPTLKTPLTSPALAPTAHYSNSPDAWLFCSTAHRLCNNTTCIQLTAIESLLIKTLAQRDERVCSKQELIIGINKDTYSYSGLEMCLSRLQSKFKGVFGERLFRSVRNRGYCLVQDVQMTE
ncbi:MULTISPECIES: winged helix-turn-helix domain-containing protein [Pseudomonas]|uniref:Winged helix-turn-helix domain-containing protein n=1 Tax=Pseudomonas fragi TaxID=296 RepID=A0ABT4WWM1_PSEFR|nr:MULTISPECIES: winged helix-turn-helix domain-containing protein [Pseudomonas]MDA7024448.1 winged helix-turn-helix domain-containing protein [Pseudomonas fragi]MDN5391455.1 winged helix-turn-helix domain-containing protein [Pseudomonas sp.]MDN5406119.1 winged helix-turn-helix domain-containing protein [Pseudomonas sp.]MDN5457694.1 winged helix-turn-helix domain-containing protein [Pseudomonas sp.]